MVATVVRPYARCMDISLPQEQAPAEAETGLTETEAAEIEARLRDLGYLE
jgi:hypothetical protein